MFRVKSTAAQELLDVLPSLEPEDGTEALSIAAELKEFAPSMDLISSGPMGSILKDDLIIEGDIVSTGPVQVFGKIKGNVDAAILTVAETGKVKGELRGRSLTINGSVRGDVHGTEVELGAQAHVSGDIAHEMFSMAKGARFDGRAKPADKTAVQTLAFGHRQRKAAA